MNLRLLVLATVICVCGSRSAEADPRFEPNLTHRPRLAFDGRDGAHATRIVQRIDAQEQPWKRAYERLRDQAESGNAVGSGAHNWRSRSDKWNVLYSQETKNGEIAAAKALVAWLYVAHNLNPAWRPLPTLPGQATPAGWVRQQIDQSRAIVAGMYDRWQCWRGFGVINRGIVAGDSLALHCMAYDLLAALPSAQRPNLSRPQERITRLAADFRYWFWTVDLYDNNHGMRVASGLGTAALTLNRLNVYRWWKPGTWWKRPKGWIRKAERNLHPTRRRSDLRKQGSTGAWAEGSSYYHYTTDLVAPFSYSYARFRRGGGVPFLRADLIPNLVRWSINLSLPDGRRAIVDNARMFRDTTPGYLLSRLPARSATEQALLLWDYERNGHPGVAGRRAAWLLAAFDPPAGLTAAGPNGAPSKILPGQGAAALRTGWTPADAHVLVNAQSGDVRKRGAGHESVANGAFTFTARGDLITVDPGYFGFTGVTKTNRGRHRSMVLVDGEGPRPAHKRFGFLGWVSGGTDTRIEQGAFTALRPDLRAVETRTRYEKTDLTRVTALVGGRALVVFDRARARRTKTFTAQVQANAGVADGRPLTRQGNVVRYATRAHLVQVCVAAASSAPLSTAITRRESSIGEGPNGHDAIEFRAGGRDVRFLTAIATNPTQGAAPNVEVLTGLPAGALGLRLTTDAGVDVVLSNPNRVPLDLPPGGGAGRVISNQTIAIVQFAVGGAKRVLWSPGPGSTQLP